MKIAILYISETIASTVYDHLNSFQKYGQYTYTYLDIFKENITVDYINKCDAIIIHYTIFLFNDDRCPAWLRVVLRNTHAKKIVFIQDEYRFVNDVIENLDFIKADVLYTCVPESEIEKVYPKETLPNLIKINTLTGFVPEKLLKIPRQSYLNRKLDVVYRARKLSAWYGRLGQEKWVIAERFAQDAKEYGLVTDISYQEKDRIYGNDWIKFLQSSKAVIGCETSASIFDFTGDIQKQVEWYEKNNSKTTFEEIEEIFFKGLDGKIRLNQISPRCFECAALRTLMILYEGDYSGILKPWRHYVPLKKDHSNMKEVVAFIRSPEKWQEIIDFAYQEVAMSKEYGYERFIKKFEDDLNHFFGFTSSSVKRSINPNDLVTQESRIENGPLKIRTLDALKKILSKLLGENSKDTIIFIKRRMMLSIRTLQFLLKEKDFYHCIYFLKKDFCEEYKFLQNVRNYSVSIHKAIGLQPLKINKLDEQQLKLVVLPYPYIANCDHFNWKDFNFAKKTIQVIVEDSWGVSKDIRGKNHMLKYPKLMNNIFRTL
jgi:hypothetical protein